jgi:cobalt/nickel transport system permease protein
MGVSIWTPATAATTCNNAGTPSRITAVVVASILHPVDIGTPPDALHAPDGFLSVPVALVMWAVTTAVLAVAVRRTNHQLSERAVPLMGVMAAFIFAAQMINFPVAGGTSGHLLGGVLAAVLLGPWAGTLVMACVVGVQGLLFQDGGLLAMGANAFNMGAIGTLGGYAAYRALCTVFGGEARGRIPAAAIAAYLAVLVGALAMALELVVSDAVPFEVTVPAMVGVHAVIGIGEALITIGALSFIGMTRREIFTLRDEPMRTGPVRRGVR